MRNIQMSRPIAVSIFASTVVACATYLTPHVIAMNVNKKIIASNEQVRDFIDSQQATSSSGKVQSGDGLFGPYV